MPSYMMNNLLNKFNGPQNLMKCEIQILSVKITQTRGSKDYKSLRT